MSHPPFSARPDYQRIHDMPLSQLRDEAADALKSGLLNTTTLWLHRQCWLRSRKDLDFLNYLLCRRQFGYMLTSCHQRRVQRILKTPSLWLLFKGLRRHQQNQLKCLLNEALHGNQPTGPQQQRARYWLSQQGNWQAQWISQLQQAQSVHVVGNSPHILELGLGPEIDNADLVVRFNHFRSEHTNVKDIGHKLSAWVAAPGYQGPDASAQQAEAERAPIIIAGPAMLYIQQRFTHLVGDKDRVVLQVPLATWRQQVRRFAAPPSAGALLLAWLLQLKAEHQLVFSLKGFGFGYDAKAQTRYHSAKPDHRPVARHNWDAEHTWMKSILSK